MKQNSHVDELVQRFTRELSVLVRETALGAARAALGTSSSGSQRPSSESVKATRGARAASPGELGELGARLLQQLRTEPHLRTEQLGRALGVSTVHIKPLLGKLVASGAVKKRGQRRGTQYSLA